MEALRLHAEGKLTSQDGQYYRGPKQIVDETSTAESFLLWGNTALTGDDAVLIGDTVFDVLKGEMTPEEWCDEMETIFAK